MPGVVKEGQDPSLYRHWTWRARGRPPSTTSTPSQRPSPRSCGIRPTHSRRAAYTVRGKAFVFFRGPRKDAHDPETGEPYTDVIAFHCTAEDKEALVGDPASPWFTTPHWNGYNAVLLLERDLAQVSVDELREVITDAWLARAPKRLAKAFLEEAP